MNHLVHIKVVFIITVLSYVCFDETIQVMRNTFLSTEPEIRCQKSLICDQQKQLSTTNLSFDFPRLRKCESVSHGYINEKIFLWKIKSFVWKWLNFLRTTYREWYRRWNNFGKSHFILGHYCLTQLKTIITLQWLWRLILI